MRIIMGSSVLFSSYKTVAVMLYRAMPFHNLDLFDDYTFFVYIILMFSTTQ